MLRVDFQFNAAHRLPFYDGPCNRTHGHNYSLRVYVEGNVDPATGIAVDFLEVKRIVQEQVLDKIDHNDLNQILENPTAEHVVVWMWQRLKQRLDGLKELQLNETADAGVIYRGEPVSGRGSHERAGKKTQPVG